MVSEVAKSEFVNDQFTLGGIFSLGDSILIIYCYVEEKARNCPSSLSVEGSI